MSAGFCQLQDRPFGLVARPKVAHASQGRAHAGRSHRVRPGDGMAANNAVSDVRDAVIKGDGGIR
eukprot:3282499-Alexandrium_andersonii.AAC.1